MFSTSLFILCFSILLARINATLETSNGADINSMPAFQIDYKRYHFGIQEMNWFKAWRECSGHGMRLASIPSQSHDEAVTKFIKDNGWSDKSFWIGAHNRGENPSNYYWVNTGVRFQYSNWSPAVNHKQDQCIGLDSAADHKWRNFDCTETVNYICETSNCTE